MNDTDLCVKHGEGLEEVKTGLVEIKSAVGSIKDNVEKLTVLLDGPPGESEKGFVHRVLALEGVKKIAIWFATVTIAAVITLGIAEVLRHL